MPYPAPDDPDYCAGSRTEIKGFDPDKIWHRCPSCGRLIGSMGKQRRFFPHVNTKKRARKGDATREGLTQYGLNNRKKMYGDRTIEYADAE